MKNETKITKVVLRVWPENGHGEILFVEERDERGYIWSMGEVDGNGKADYAHVVSQTQPMDPAHQERVLKVMKDIGYENVKVLKRYTLPNPGRKA